MTYAVRNTLILLLALAVIAGGGFSYIHFVQKSQIEELEAELAGKQSAYAEMSAVAENFPVFSTAVARAEDFIAGYDKTLFPTDDPDHIYRFLANLNFEWPRLEFNFAFADSTQQGEYGVVNSNVSGVGSWRAIYNFVNRIENSRPVQKVTDLVVSPVNQEGEFGNANFTFRLRSYYNRSDRFETSLADLQQAMHVPDRFHNPFYPLIRQPDSNDDNLTDVENSRLVGVGSSRIFLRNQDDRLINLTLNDRVWLGTLQSIDARRGEAVFRLNKGGIIEEVTLNVQR